MKKPVLLPAVIAISVITAALLAVNFHKEPAPIFTGMVEVREIDIAAKVPGRIGKMLVREGDIVQAGDTAALIESPEIEAKVGQAESAAAAAKARLLMAQRGLRPQEKEAAQRQWLQAKAQADLMAKTWKRVEKLAQDSVISNQERDQVFAQYQAAQEQMEAAAARLAMAREGTRAEDKMAAEALADQASMVFTEASSGKNELTVKIPADGEIAKIIVNPGEIAGAGTPILTLADTKDQWVVLQVKETDMSQFRKGSVHRGTIPALDAIAEEFTVFYIAPMGDFASWRPTHQKGEFDIKTFEIRLRPAKPIADLRAGMSVNFSGKE